MSLQDSTAQKPPESKPKSTLSKLTSKLEKTKKKMLKQQQESLDKKELLESFFKHKQLKKEDEKQKTVEESEKFI